MSGIINATEIIIAATWELLLKATDTDLLVPASLRPYVLSAMLDAKLVTTVSCMAVMTAEPTLPLKPRTWGEVYDGSKRVRCVRFQLGTHSSISDGTAHGVLHGLCCSAGSVNRQFSARGLMMEDKAG